MKNGLPTSVAAASRLPRGAALWGANPSAIMLRHRSIRRWLGLAIAVLLAPVSPGDAQSSESIARDRVDSAAVWIPDPVETIDAPERRDEPPEGWSVRAQAGWGGASPAARRIWWSGRAPSGLREAAFAQRAARADGGALWESRTLCLGAGALAIADFGLPGETSGLIRRVRGLGFGGDSFRDRATRVAPGSGADMTGAAIERRDAIRMAWGEMRRAEGAALVLEVRGAGRAARGVLVRRDHRTMAYGGFAIAGGRAANRVAVEAAAGPAGVTARIDAAVRVATIRGSTRWSYEPERQRPVTLDLETAWVVRDAAARFRWRSWSAGASVAAATSAAVRGAVDDGRAEADLRIGRGDAGTLLVRFGARPREADGTGGERYVIGDLVVAHEPGRTLRLLAGERSVQAGAGWRRGRAMGAMLEVERRHRASFTLTAEVVHAEDGAGSYSQGLDVAGGGSLRARTRTGLRAAGRGWIGFGMWRCGAAVDDEDAGSTDETTSGETRAPRVNLWLAWSGGSGAR